MKPAARATVAALGLLSVIGCSNVLGLRDDYYVIAGAAGSAAGSPQAGSGAGGNAGNEENAGASNGATGGSGGDAAGGAGGVAGGAGGVGPLFTMPAGKLVFERYTTYAAGDSEMFIVTFPGGTVSPPLGETYGLCALYNGIFSPDGHHLVVGAVPESVCPSGTLDRNELEVYILDLDHPGKLNKQRVTDNAVPDEDPQYAKDGKSILFKHGGYLARWVIGATPFAETCADPDTSYCFKHSGSTFQSKPVVDADGYVCYESSLAPGDPGGEILCFGLAEGLAGKDITLADNVAVTVDHAQVYDSRPVMASPFLYYTSWISPSDRINKIWRKQYKDLSVSEQPAAFCTDTSVSYADPFSLAADGDTTDAQNLLVFSTSAKSKGKSDLFVGNFNEPNSMPLSDVAPGVNTPLDELGATFWRAPTTP